MTWSLSTGDLESLHLVVILLLCGTGWQTWIYHCLACLVGAHPVGHHRCSSRGLPESLSPRNARGTVASIWLPWSSREWRGRGVPSWDILSDPDLLVFSSPKLGSLDSGASDRMVSSGRHSPTSKSLLLQQRGLLMVAGVERSDLDHLYFFFKKL